MGSEWRVRSLSEAARIISGGTPRTSVPEYWGGDIPWLSVKDFNIGYRRVYEAEKHITALGLQESSTEVLEPGQVIVSARGTVGVVAQVGCAMAFNQSCYGLDARPEICCNDFLYYLLVHTTRALRSLAYGAVFDTITQQTFDQVMVRLPPLPEQHAIAHILGAMDDKIELNRRMSATLEEMARALFRAWFVDFEPVRAKQAGRQSVSAPGALADLLPDKLAPSELGPIPEGWRVGRLGKLFSVTMGQSPPGESYNEAGKGMPFYQGRRDFGDRFPTRRVYCTDPRRLAHAGDTLMSVRAPVGDLNMASEECCVGRGVAAIRHRFGLRSYTYHAVSGVIRELELTTATGTVFSSISGQDLRDVCMIAPSRQTIETFEKLATPFDDRFEQLHIETATLASLRDALLPKLISGELRVEDAERWVEEGM